MGTFASGDPPFVPDLAYLWTPFITFHVLGEAGSILLILTYFFSRNVHRHPTLVNFWITWIVYSVSYSILLYDRQQYTHPDTLCRVQAAMVDGSPSMVVTAGLIAVILLWRRMHRPSQAIYKLPSTTKQKSQIRLVLCLIAPYVVFLAFGIGSALIGGQDSLLTNPSNGLYCSLKEDGFSRYGIPAYCTAVMSCLLGFEVAIAVKYWKIRTTTSRAFTLLKRDVHFSPILRMLLFNVISVMVLSISIIFISDWLVPWLYMMQATLCVFGTQQDFLMIWACWRRPTFKPQLRSLHIVTSVENLPPIPSIGVPDTSSAGGFRTRSASLSLSVERVTVSDEEPV
ncbi:hypothetical protein DFJ43DRAFT_578954 [Lentinula guzmanii]|uniref:Uncharacterized protein n=1 Tax=Lentinula guzmanii TaxID=2804957 RepID=A0AA38JBG7_9AGAR|nr:hypothetical protein DFJ43DRAFT_578954 [Lentinula guzmanii]